MPNHPSEWRFALFGEDGAPNLDGLSIDPNDLDKAARVLRILSRYATLKAQAMRARSVGMIPQALDLERDLESLYQRLPQWARW